VPLTTQHGGSSFSAGGEAVVTEVHAVCARAAAPAAAPCCQCGAGAIAHVWVTPVIYMHALQVPVKSVTPSSHGRCTCRGSGVSRCTWCGVIFCGVHLSGAPGGLPGPPAASRSAFRTTQAHHWDAGARSWQTANRSPPDLRQTRHCERCASCGKWK
jgi:hypothetical protein